MKSSLQITTDNVWISDVDKDILCGLSLFFFLLYGGRHLYTNHTFYINVIYSCLILQMRSLCLWHHAGCHDCLQLCPWPDLYLSLSAEINCRHIILYDLVGHF